ncbi:MAG TPA: Xaa-Pro peptidase family protein [Fimbriiglobus sp.]|jgi:Xaa-Pro aminopeptidase
MITAAGCLARRQRFLDRFRPTGPVLLTDPLSHRYFANFYVDPLSISADYRGVLRLDPDGKSALWYDKRVPKDSAAAAFVDAMTAVPWYDGKSPGQGPRRLILRPAIEENGGRVIDDLNGPDSIAYWTLLNELRRAKDPDEVETIRACCRSAEAGFAWSRANVKPGMTELDVYAAIEGECTKAAGRAVVVYGDFAVSPGSARRGGPPTRQTIRPGDTLILDYSVILQGYRSDFTNTLVVGAEPTREQKNIFDVCVSAMESGEKCLKAGASCLTVRNGVADRMSSLGLKLVHHAGHGLGLSHPEAPFFVEAATEQLVAGDVVTLEPGAYVDGVGGVRIEHNYLITDTGFEKLSRHEIHL